MEGAYEAPGFLEAGATEDFRVSGIWPDIRKKSEETQTVQSKIDDILGRAAEEPGPEEAGLDSPKVPPKQDANADPKEPNEPAPSTPKAKKDGP